MAKIGNIKLIDKPEKLDSGAAFLLRMPSPISSTVPLDENSFVEVEKGNHYVVVRTIGLNEYKQAFRYGLELAQKGLDILSIIGKADLSTRDVIDENLVWWSSGDEVNLRITDTSSISFSIEKKGALLGDVIASYPVYSTAYRYFRLSQITDDLFDAYRNMYLAFEFLASESVPRKKTPTKSGKIQWESESLWLKRYLSSINQEILTSTFYGILDYKQAFIDQIYKTARCSLFHAKDGESFFSPHGDIVDRKTVADAMDKLTRIFLLLSKEKNPSIRGLGASMSTGSQKSMFISSYVNDSFFILSDDDSPFDQHEEGFDHPRYKNVIKSGTVTENPSITHEFSLIGKIKNIKTGGLTKIRCVELANEKTSLCTGILEVPLFIDGFDFIEIQLNQKMISAKSAKQKFTM
ncbi:hypothetical protein [Methyloglobulus sp.]|uniref:hypothetical protein n=1 Tax=Methyloglobulus sp. TaxID=2518622 RepID=UPI003989F00B